MTKQASFPAALALCLLPAVASAQSAPNQEMLKQYCTGDYFTHCGQFAPGGPEVEACFRAKAKLISPNCAAAIATYQQDQRPVRKVSAAR